MKTNDKNVLLILIRDIERRYSGDANNDMFLEDTEGNREIIDRANALSKGCPYEDWEEHEDYTTPLIGEDGKLVANNLAIVAYLKSKLQNELEERT